MIDRGRVVAVIPARGGSTGLPGKNIRNLCGKPLIAWSIEQGLSCEHVDAVLVSTDSEEIASIAARYGAEVPVLRPASLATDAASSIDVLFHALDSLSELDESYDYVVLLEPTSPLREVTDITGALELLGNREQVESVVGVAPVEGCHPCFLYEIDAGLLRPFSGSQPTGIRRQELSANYYYLEGSIYVSSVSRLREARSFYHAATAPWFVDRYKAIQIDELSDFIAVEALMKARLEGLLA